MNQNDFNIKMSKLVKLIRIEYELNQEQMSEIIGLSKKTLIEIEKQRKLLTWANSIAIATIFENSEILNMNFGDDIIELIKLISFNNINYTPKLNIFSKTLGGKICWNDIKIINGYKIQQNLFSKHYRLLDSQNNRISSSFNIDKLIDLEQKINKDNK